MVDIISFSFNWKSIRTIHLNNEPFFVAADVAKALWYKDTRKAIKQHCDEGVKRPVIDNMWRNQYNIVIPESDVYALIFWSSLKEAKEFKKWVTKEVLPSIRKTWQYSHEEFLKLKQEKDRIEYMLHRTEDLLDIRNTYKR